MFKITESNEKPKFITGNYFLKGIIHITGEKEFEVFGESFFYTGLESNGHFQNQEDIGIYLEYELSQLDWDIEPEINRCCGVLYEFKCNHYQDYWGDYNVDVEVVNLHFSRFDDDANEAIIDYNNFQFEE